MKVVACSAGYGVGGLGQHLAQIVEEGRAHGSLSEYYASSVKSEDRIGRRIEARTFPWLAQYTPLRIIPSWKTYVSSVLFDQSVARCLVRQDAFHGFSGLCLTSFRRARQLGYARLLLEAPSVHANRVMQQQKRATARYGIEGGWLNDPMRRRMLAEYEMADEIWVASRLTYETFVAEGVPADKLRRRTLVADARFRPSANRTSDDMFRIVYVGALTVLKGLPVLLEAFARLGQRPAELTLVGGYTSRGMRRYLQRRVNDDPRIRIVVGDPLPYLQRADVYVHPSYTDGLGLSPLEALACGVPVIVTEDTGMKEVVEEGRTGYVVPTGSWEAVLDALRKIHASRQSSTAR